MLHRFLLLPLIAILLFSCQKKAQQTQPPQETTTAQKPEKRQFPSAQERGKFLEKEGRRYLWGGENEAEHFDITGYTLKDENFHFGIGRERFPALLEPEFISSQAADAIWADSSRFLLLHMDGVTKAYSIKDLTRHEVVNDEINGKPVMAAYCILADLGAIYDRQLGNHTYTFALSGYTYQDEKVWDGMDGFVMWDRETESLWWPLIGKAVSGPLQGTEMQVLEEKHWSQTTWGEVKKQYPEVLVLKSGQDFERPADWPTYEDVKPVKADGKAVAPRWGEN